MTEFLPGKRDAAPTFRLTFSRMHDVPDIHTIRVLHKRGIPKRQIARWMHVSRNTVDKYTAANYVVPVRPALKLSQPRSGMDTRRAHEETPDRPALCAPSCNRLVQDKP